MKIIDPSVELVESTGSVTKDIEVAARNCYLSYDKMDEGGSDVQIVTNLIKRGHMAMMEFGSNLIFNCLYHGFDSDFMNFLFLTGLNKFVVATYEDGIWTYSMNPRTALAIYYTESDDEILRGLRFIIERKYSDLILDKIPPYPDSDWDIFEEVSVHELSHDAIKKHVTVTAKLITNRTVLAQITRHRLASFAVTSMRYINWTKEKFGSELTFVKPTWLMSSNDEYNDWIEVLEMSETKYMKAVSDDGLKPQEARSFVSPDVRTDIIMKASLEEWIDVIFKERCSPAADADIRHLMEQLEKKIKDNFCI